MAVTTFSNDGLVFGVEDAGPADGEVVVLLHGFPQLPISFSAVADLLHERGYRTLAPTGRGYAPSCRPHRRRDYTADKVAADVVALLDAAGVAQAHVVGHDWGGAQAWTVAGRHPQRVATLTSLATPHPDALRRAFRTADQLRRSWYMLAFQLPWLPERAAVAMVRGLSRVGLPERQADAYADAFRTPDSLTGPINWYRGLPFSRPLGPVRVPTTYVWGEHDPFLGRAAAEATAPYVDAPYTFTALDADHWLPEKNPQQVAEAILARIG